MSGEPCSCLAAATDIPCICNPEPVDTGWLDRVLRRNRKRFDRLPKPLRFPLKRPQP